VRRLPQRFTKYGHQFEQLCRTKRSALYIRHVNGRQKSYEVIVIRVVDRRPIKTEEGVKFVHCAPYECYPSCEKWGMCGWTYSTEKDARTKYELINDPSDKSPTSPPNPIWLRATDGIVQDCGSCSRSIKTAEVAEPCLV